MIGTEVTRTAKKLDQIDPHWYTENRIDLSIFDSSSYKTCVIGQAFMGRRGEHNFDAAQYGPEVAANLGMHGEDMGTLAGYTEQWIEAIEDRRNADQGQVPSHIAPRIAVLKHRGSIVALQNEVTTRNNRIAQHLNESARSMRTPDYAWIRVQTEAAEAFQAEADRLDAQGA